MIEILKFYVSGCLVWLGIIIWIAVVSHIFETVISAIAEAFWSGQSPQHANNGARDSMTHKLTQAQKRVYNEMIERGEYRCIGTYKPALALVSAGLAAIERESSGTIRIVPINQSARGTA